MVEASTLFVHVTISNAITVIILFFYIPTVFENFTFTNSGLSFSDVPYYVGGSTNVWWSTAQYSYQWGELASDILRFLPPMMSLSAMTTGCIYRKTGSFWFYQIVVILLMVWEAWKTVTRGVAWAFCRSDPFCHGYDGSVDPGNWIFIMSFWSCPIFFFWFFYYIWQINSARTIYTEHRESEESGMTMVDHRSFRKKGKELIRTLLSNKKMAKMAMEYLKPKS
jgi:hypothetical protein